MAQTSVNIRMDETIKKEFDTVCNELGFNMTTAVNVFARAVIRKHGIPFDISMKTPNVETLEAIREVEEMVKSGTGQKFSSVDELFRELNR